MLKTIVLAAILCCICLTAGCGDGGAAVLKRRSNLSTLGLAYHEYHQANGKSAGGVTELAQYMSANSSESTAAAITSLEEGDIVMIWDGVLADGSENAKYVLGFEARAPAGGGYVVMGDGEVRLMTGKDFSESTMIPTAVAAE